MEPGPGIYTIPDLGVALNYAGPNGATMVFKDTNFQGLAMCNLVDKPEEWRAIINANPRRSLTDAVVLPEEYHQAEVITGAISENFRQVEGSKGNYPVPKMKEGMMKGFPARTATGHLLLSESASPSKISYRGNL